LLRKDQSDVIPHETLVWLSLQLVKAQKVVAAVPAVLSTIRSSSGRVPNGGPQATPFAAGAAGAAAGTPPLQRGGISRGPAVAGGPRSGSGVQGSADVEELLSRIPPEFRPDVARMLLNSQEKGVGG
jgi:hypothetical protein